MHLLVSLRVESKRTTSPFCRAECDRIRNSILRVRGLADINGNLKPSYFTFEELCYNCLVNGLREKLNCKR